MEKGLVYTSTAKGGSGRILKLKDSALAMLKAYLAEHECRSSNTSNMTRMWMRTRDRVAKRLQEPELKKYCLYDLRHFYATMLYHRTKGILHVTTQLVHRNLQHTLIYLHVANFADDGFTGAVEELFTNAANLSKRASRLSAAWMESAYSESQNKRKVEFWSQIVICRKCFHTFSQVVNRCCGQLLTAQLKKENESWKRKQYQEQC